MIVPAEKINQAKAEYDGQAIKEIMEHFGYEYDGKKASMLCPFHNDKNASFMWNPKANSFHCFGCLKNYDIIDLYLDQGMTFLEATKKLFDNVGYEYSFDERGRQSKPTYRYPKREINHDRTLVEEYLATRKISKKTLDYADIQADEHGNIVFHYYDTNDVLLNVKYRPSRIIKKGETKCWFQQDADTSPILFNMNRIDPTKPLVCCEGEVDCLSIIEAGYTNVVSVPTGAQSFNWINECWNWLEQFSKIIIWSDNDEPGIKMRNECTRRLGTWRTSYVEIKKEDVWNNNSQVCKDANEILYFYGKDRVMEYINNPIDTPIEGVIDLADAEDFDIEQAEGLYTGLQDLDDQIYKLVFGTVTLITGKSGSGKSTFATQIGIAEALNQGYNCFVYSGELPAPILKNWVETNLIGRENITVKSNHARVLDPKAREKVRDWYKGRVILYDDSLGVNPKSLLEKMEEAVRKLGCRVITIDNLMCIDLMCNESERLEAEKNFVKDLVLFAKKFNVLILLLAHPRKQSPNEESLNLQSISGSSAIGNLCHMALAVHRYTNKEKEGETNARGDYIKGHEPKQYDTYIEVIKNRITGLMPKVEAYFDFPSYRFYRTPQEVWKRYKWNDDLKPISDIDPNSHTLIKESPING